MATADVQRLGIGQGQVNQKVLEEVAVKEKKEEEEEAEERDMSRW